MFEVGGLSLVRDVSMSVGCNLRLDWIGGCVGVERLRYEGRTSHHCTDLSCRVCPLLIPQMTQLRDHSVR